MTEQDLKRLEHSTYRATADSGLWDVFLASVVSMLAIAPLLSRHLGDFWSAAVFLPVFAVVLIGIRVVQERVVRPRVGVVEYAPPRRRRLKELSVIMLVVNVVALVLGALAARRGVGAPSSGFAWGLPLVLLVGFSMAAFYLEIGRVFFYGLLLASGALLGEALWNRGYVSHHGFPVMFGACALVILVSGIVRFVRFLPPPPGEVGGPMPEGNHE